MKDARPDLKADPEERAEPPDFDELASPDELVRGDRTRDDFFDAVLQLDAPATVDEVADLADHGTDAAREYLDWFERMGIVTRVGESPAAYRLNREYLAWRRGQRLRAEYDDAELVEFLEAATDRDRAFASEFDVESPGDVTLSEYAAAADLSIEQAWEALVDWRTTRRRIALLERALAAEADDSSGRRRGVA